MNYFITTIFLSFSCMFLHGQWEKAGLSAKIIMSIYELNDTLYATTHDGIYKKGIYTEDTNWVSIGMKGEVILDLVLFSHSEMMLAKQLNAYPDTISIYRTTDGGAHWNEFQNGFGGPGGGYYGLTACAQLEIDSRYPDTIYARGGYVVAKSTDRGNSWELKYPEEWDALGYQSTIMKIDTNKPSHIWAGGELPLFQAFLLKSTDYGNTWEQFDDEMNPEQNNASNCLFINPDDSDDLFLGMEGRIMRSRDGAHTWDSVLTPPSYTYILDIALSKTNPGILYATGSDNGTLHGDLMFYASYDFGTSWDTVYSGIGNDFYANDLLIREDSGRDKLFFGTNKGVYTYTTKVTQTSEKMLENDIRVYPNPVQDKLNVCFKNKHLGDIEIQMINIHGQTITRSKLTSGGLTILDVSHLTPGFYILQVIGQNRQMALPVVKR
ncbi:MAG: T9SS type A sorting domain-containing protein [Cyclobacteriaceae bacterium]